MSYPDPILVDFVRGKAVRGSDITLYVADSAIEHRMAPLLLDALAAPETMAPSVAARLTAFELAVGTRRRQQHKVMELVHRRLDDHGVRHTFVKGATSAKRWFDKPTHRPYVDIDIVVPRPDLRKAVEAFDESHPILDMSEADTEGQLSSVVLVVDGVAIDLQTDALRSGLAPRDSTAWAVGSHRVGLDEDLSLPVLDNEHDLVVFLLHQGRDRFRYLLGMAEASRRLDGPIAWERIEALARHEGIWEQIAVSLEVICQELGRATPVAIPQGWRTTLWRYLWRRKVRLLGELGRIKHIRRADWVMPLTMRGRTIDAIRWIWRSAFPSDAIIRLRHPSATGPYLWRVVTSRSHIISHRRRLAWRNPPAKRER